MPSPFDALDASLQAEMDKAFGEGITIRPQVGGNYSVAADSLRPVKTGVRAIVSHSPREAATDFRNSNRNGVPLALSPSSAWLQRAAIAALGAELRRGDVIEFPEAGAPAPTAVVAVAQKGDHGDLNLIFTASGEAAE